MSRFAGTNLSQWEDVIGHLDQWETGTWCWSKTEITRHDSNWLGVSLCPADTLQSTSAQQQTNRLFAARDFILGTVSISDTRANYSRDWAQPRELPMISILWIVVLTFRFRLNLLYTDYIMDLLWAVFHHLSLNNPKLDFGKPNFVTVSSFLFKFNAWYSIKTLLCGGCGPPLPTIAVTTNNVKSLFYVTFSDFKTSLLNLNQTRCVS